MISRSLQYLEIETLSHSSFEKSLIDGKSQTIFQGQNQEF